MFNAVPTPILTSQFLLPLPPFHIWLRHEFDIAVRLSLFPRYHAVFTIT